MAETMLKEDGHLLFAQRSTGVSTPPSRRPIEYCYSKQWRCGYKIKSARCSRFERYFVPPL